MRLSKQNFVVSVRRYSGKTFFGLTLITAVIWVNGQFFSFLLENLLMPICTENLKSVAAVVAEESLESDTDTHTHTHRDFDM